MSGKTKYLVKFTNAYNDDGTVWYSIKVFEGNESWQFKERYSKMREIHQNCQKTQYKNDLPQFPPRRFFGNTKEEFIQKRKKELENYYSTLFKTINIEVFPQLLAFFNTNKPVKTAPKPSPIVASNQPIESKQDPNKIVKLKKNFEEIVAKTQAEMVQSNDFYNDIEDQTRRKFNQQFQKLKLDLKNEIVDGIALPKGQKENDGEYWSMFFHDQHDQNLKKLDSVSNSVSQILGNSHFFQKDKFVMVL